MFKKISNQKCVNDVIADEVGHCISDSSGNPDVTWIPGYKSEWNCLCTDDCWGLRCIYQVSWLHIAHWDHAKKNNFESLSERPLEMCYYV